MRMEEALEVKMLPAVMEFESFSPSHEQNSTDISIEINQRTPIKTLLTEEETESKKTPEVEILPAVLEFKSPSKLHGQNTDISIQIKEETPIKSFLPEKEIVSILAHELYIEKGVTDNNAIVEIKSLYRISREGLTLIDGCKKYKNTCLELVDGLPKLKENHNYFYQIQGQLNITKKINFIS
ncbi:hypothetical protein RN001_005822 [Aquatica leii]|uniref:Uncharacterized protein n=1 Tax=Aquatica leii TaxID=1421715 RepID=A0AAN7PD82_9COLE|nr:hypothetical protein RN001_005822 [Aquatica leii]